MQRLQILILVVVLAVGTVIIVTVLALIPLSGPASIVILDTDSVWTDSGSLIISGRLINSGHTRSNPVILEISLADANNSPLGTASTAPNPSIIEPGMEATFSKDVSHLLPDNYAGRYNYLVTVLSW